MSESCRKVCTRKMVGKVSYSYWICLWSISSWKVQDASYCFQFSAFRIADGSIDLCRFSTCSFRGKFHTFKKRTFAAPGAPILIPEECSAENNSVTVAWQPPPGHGIVGCAGQRGPAIEGYLLELDDGCGGEFRVSRNFSTCIAFE